MSARVVIAGRSSAAGRRLGWLWQPRTGGLILLGLILLLLPLALPNRFYVSVAVLVGINALVAVGLNLLVGYAGQISLGHAGFFGLGAYACGILPAHLGVPPLLAPVIGIVVVAGIAFVVGRPILRLKGHYLAMATLGLGILVSLLIGNERELTGGPDGMQVERLVIFGTRLRQAEVWYWIVAVFLFLGVWVALNLMDSPTGRALRALHDSEVGAQVNGVDVAAYKLLVFVISAIYAALAGALNALYAGLITPDLAGFLRSVEFLTMVVLGGMGTIFGSLVGAAILTSLPQFLTALHEYEQIVLGLILMACMILLPKGIVPTLAQRLGRARR
ncbi:MAG TPA: branched-chain amino acid ABC transporter permease [Geminicoccaceae bacterium]|nr:branched-chain amino acid ABC transporter permease [Geminicoccaceae bacterium]